MHASIREAALGFAPLLAVSLAALPLTAQSGTPVPPTPPPPSISTSAIGETSVVPDRAMLSVAVESQGQTAAAAGAENAKLQSHVIDAVKAAGVTAAQIRTSGYNVYPEYAQASGKGPRVTGYRAQNTVQIEIRNLESVGKVIDGVLAAGATNLSALSLYASNTDAARREALQSAQGVGMEIVGPHGSEQTMRILEFARANRLPYTWEDAAPSDGGVMPLVRLPGAGELRNPTPGDVSRALGVGHEPHEFYGADVDGPHRGRRSLARPG